MARLVGSRSSTEGNEGEERERVGGRRERKRKIEKEGERKDLFRWFGFLKPEIIPLLNFGKNFFFLRVLSRDFDF